MSGLRDQLGQADMRIRTVIASMLPICSRCHVRPAIAYGVRCETCLTKRMRRKYRYIQRLIIVSLIYGQTITTTNQLRRYIKIQRRQRWKAAADARSAAIRCSVCGVQDDTLTAPSVWGKSAIDDWRCLQHRQRRSEMEMM